MSAREAVAMALLRHIEGDDVTRALITDDEWAGYLSDADYVSGLISAAGWVVVPREPTPHMVNRGLERADINWREASEDEALSDDEARRIYRAMIAAALPAAPQEERDDAR